MEIDNKDIIEYYNFTKNKIIGILKLKKLNLLLDNCSNNIIVDKIDNTINIILGENIIIDRLNTLKYVSNEDIYNLYYTLFLINISLVNEITIILNNYYNANNNLIYSDHNYNDLVAKKDNLILKLGLNLVEE